MSSFSLKISIDKCWAGRRAAFVVKLLPNKSYNGEASLKQMYCRIKWDQYVLLRLKTIRLTLREAEMNSKRDVPGLI